MTDLSLSMKHFRKLAKLLTKQVRDADADACTRVRLVYRDSLHKTNAELSSAFGLQRAQHVIAVERGFKSWGALLTKLSESERRTSSPRAISNSAKHAWSRTAGNALKSLYTCQNCHATVFVGFGETVEEVAAVGYQNWREREAGAFEPVRTITRAMTVGFISPHCDGEGAKPPLTDASDDEGEGTAKALKEPAAVLQPLKSGGLADTIKGHATAKSLLGESQLAIGMVDALKGHATAKSLLGESQLAIGMADALKGHATAKSLLGESQLAIGMADALKGK